MALGRRADRPRSRSASSVPRPEHLLGERHQAVRPPVGRRLGDESRPPAARGIRPSSASRCIAFRAVIRLTPNSAHSSASDGSRSPGLEGRDPLAQGLLDLAVVGLAGRPGHRRLTDAGAAVPRALRPPLAPWMAAPIAPGPRPELGGHDLDLVERRGARAVAARRGSGPAGGRPPPRSRRRSRPVGRDDGDHVGDADPEVAADLGEAPSRGRRPPGPARPLPRPWRSRTRPRSGRPGRTPPGSRGSRSRTTARRVRSSGGRSRRPCRRGPGGPGRRRR